MGKKKKSKLKGKIILIVGPSGSGKGSVIAELKKRYPDWVYPISYTTRKKRPKEIDGEIYHFISKEEFKKGIKEGKFLEYAQVHSDHYYGTIKKEIINALEEGKVVVREIDIQGFESIREIVPAENLLSIFLMVESLDDLLVRISKRGKLPEEEIKRRMASAKREIDRSDECDYILPTITGQIVECADEVEDIILESLRG